MGNIMLPLTGLELEIIDTDPMADLAEKLVGAILYCSSYILRLTRVFHKLSRGD